MISACPAGEKILVTLGGEAEAGWRLERRTLPEEKYAVYTAEGFRSPESGIPPAAVRGDIVDPQTEGGEIYAYRCIRFDAENPQDADWFYSNWVRRGGEDAFGYTFGNYSAPGGHWGTVITPDDLRYTYLWGTDLRASNGQAFTDEQIQYFIDAGLSEMERRLDITIRKKRIRCNASARRLRKGVDYDAEEAPYDFRYSRIARYGLIKTRQKPIICLHKLEILSRLAGCRDITASTVVDKTKGLLKLMERPLKPDETSSGIQTAIGMYGNQTMNPQLFYAVDYDAGFETSDDVPADLREIVAKTAAIGLLNVIGDGLLSGFSSSSLSMDGISESFSSTQSATSAYFGARIKEYKDDVDSWIAANKNKFGHMAIAAL